MRQPRLLAAVAASACTMLAGALMLAGPASAATVSPHPMTTVVPRAGFQTTTSLALDNTRFGGDGHNHQTDFDQESFMEANFTVTTNVANITPVGTVDIRTVLADGTTTVDLCSGTLVSAGQGSCFLTDGELPPGSYQLTAHYEGVVGKFEFSDSGPQPLAVAKEPTTVTLTHPSSTVAFGQESANRYTLQVTPRTSGTPTGLAGVDFKGAGGFNTGLCGGDLANGTATCAAADTELFPGTYQIFGFYNSDETYAGAQTALETLIVTPGVTITTLELSSPQISFGRQSSEQLTALVAPVKAGTPAGTVKIMAGDSTICPDQPLAGGTVTCHLASSQLQVGTHPLTAVYSGDTNFAGTASAPVTLTVTSPTTTSLTLSTRTIQAGHETAERLTVKVSPVITGSGTPRGQVTIKAGTTTLCVITLSNATGSCRLSPSKLRPGTYHLTAHYAGVIPFTASTSPSKTLTVTR